MAPKTGKQPDIVEIDLTYYWNLLKSNWLLIMLVPICLTIVAFAISQLLTPIYLSTSTLYIDARSSGNSADLNGLRVSESLAQTYSEMIVSRDVLEKTIDELGLFILPRDLEKSVTARPVANTQLIRVSVEDSNRQRAADLANTISTIFIDEITNIQLSAYSDSEENFTTQLEFLDGQISSTLASIEELADSDGLAEVAERNRLETLLSEYNRDYSSLLQSFEQLRLSSIETSSIVRQSEEAIPEIDPVRPATLLNVVLGFGVGLLSALGFVFIRDLLDDTVRDYETLGRQLNLPIIGRILPFEQGDGQLITVTSPRSPMAESFREVRLNLDYAGVDEALNSVLITSASPGDGKSTLSSNLSVVLAQGGKETILIDGDMRRPKIHKIFDMSNSEGLSNLFLPSANGSLGSMRQVKVGNLNAMPAGPAPPNPSELFYSRRAAEIVESAEKISDIVVIDTPPLSMMTDAVALSRCVDGVIFAVRYGKTKRKLIEQAVESMRKVNARILGLVIVGVSNREVGYGYYYAIDEDVEPQAEKKRQDDTKQSLQPQKV